LRSRACIRCKKYVIIQPNDPNNQKLIKMFESNHQGHNLVTLDLNEVKGIYEKIESVEEENS